VVNPPIQPPFSKKPRLDFTRGDLRFQRSRGRIDAINDAINGAIKKKSKKKVDRELPVG
jgi:hypothetical protein